MKDKKKWEDLFFTAWNGEIRSQDLAKCHQQAALNTVSGLGNVSTNLLISPVSPTPPAFFFPSLFSPSLSFIWIYDVCRASFPPTPPSSPPPLPAVPLHHYINKSCIIYKTVSFHLVAICSIYGTWAGFAQLTFRDLIDFPRGKKSKKNTKNNQNNKTIRHRHTYTHTYIDTHLKKNYKL